VRRNMPNISEDPLTNSFLEMFACYDKFCDAVRNRVGNRGQISVTYKGRHCKERCVYATNLLHTQHFQYNILVNTTTLTNFLQSITLGAVRH